MIGQYAAAAIWLWVCLTNLARGAGSVYWMLPLAIAILLKISAQRDADGAGGV